MSAVNIFVAQHKAQIATDGAGYAETGELRAVFSKVYAQAHWPGVIVARGPALAPVLLANELGMMFQTFDALVAEIAAVLPDMIARNEWAWAELEVADVELF